MTLGQVKAKENIKWMGPTQNVIHVEKFMILEVLQNRIQGDSGKPSIGYHIFNENGSSASYEYYQTISRALLAIAVLMEHPDKSSLEVVHYMAKLGDLK